MNVEALLIDCFCPIYISYTHLVPARQPGQGPVAKPAGPEQCKQTGNLTVGWMRDSNSKLQAVVDFCVHHIVA